MRRLNASGTVVRATADCEHPVFSIDNSAPADRAGTLPVTKSFFNLSVRTCGVATPLGEYASTRARPKKWPQAAQRSDGPSHDPLRSLMHTALDSI